jgi:cytoskeletal protein RodZ
MSANPTGDTIGEILKRTRESRNLTVETVNRETKISVNVIRALEQDDLESFSSETYLKGFLKNYAKYLELEPDQLWSMLNRQKGSVPDGKGTFWDIEEAVREEKLKSPKIVQRIVVPILIIVIVVLTVLFIRERSSRDETGAVPGGDGTHLQDVAAVHMPSPPSGRGKV